MLRANLQLLFRQVIKVVAGGPADKTRGGNLIDALDKLSESAVLAEDLPALLVTNKLRGTPKIVGTMAARQVLETAGVLTVATTCYVQNTAGISEQLAGVVAPAAVYVVAINNSLPTGAGFLAYADGGDTSTTVRCEWVLSDSSAAQVATFEAWDEYAHYLPGNGQGYPGPGTLGGPAQVKHLENGTWQLYEATQDVTAQYSGGDEYLPEPGTPAGAAFWQAISPPALGGGGGGGAALSDDAPLANGAAAAGTSPKASRADHVHPTDATRAPLASPAFTGIPTAPTAPLGTNTSQVATMAALQVVSTTLTTAIESVRTTAVLRPAQAANYTLQLADAGGIVPFTAAAVCTIPGSGTVNFPIGTIIEIAQEGAGQVTIAAASGVALRTGGGLKTANQWASVGLRKRALDEWVLTSAVS